MKQIVQKIKKIFDKNDNLRLVLKDRIKKNPKKRKYLKINLEFLNRLNQFKGKYIPYFLIFSGIIVLIIFGSIFGPFFKVKNIEIIRKDNVTNMDIAYKSMDFFRGEKMFDLKEIDVFNRLKNYQDNIKSVNMELDLPNTLTVEVESYKEIYNVFINDNTYLLLENGTLVPGTHSKNLRLLNVSTSIDKNKFIEYKQIFTQKYLSRINVIIKKIEENFVNLKIKTLYYYEEERELHLELENGELIIFSIDNDDEINNQIEKLAIFNKDYDGIDKGLFSYIDLRIRNKVFYCSIESKAQCDANINGIYKE